MDYFFKVNLEHRERDFLTIYVVICTTKVHFEAVYRHYL